MEIGQKGIRGERFIAPLYIRATQKPADMRKKGKEILVGVTIA
jgi:hypothetical protein